VASPNDNNGAGATRSVLLDISSLTSTTNSSTAKLLTIDAQTDPINGPAENTVVLTAIKEIDFNGYGVAFLTFK
jgi:hypothetical protein